MTLRAVTGVSMPIVAQRPGNNALDGIPLGILNKLNYYEYFEDFDNTEGLSTTSGDGQTWVLVALNAATGHTFTNEPASGIAGGGVAMLTHTSTVAHNGAYVIRQLAAGAGRPGAMPHPLANNTVTVPGGFPVSFHFGFSMQKSLTTGTAMGGIGPAAGFSAIISAASAPVYGALAADGISVFWGANTSVVTAVLSQGAGGVVGTGSIDTGLTAGSAQPFCRVDAKVVYTSLTTGYTTVVVNDKVAMSVQSILTPSVSPMLVYLGGTSTTTTPARAAFDYIYVAMPRRL